MKAKKIIIPIAVIAGIAIIGGAVAALGNSASKVAYADTVIIQQKSLEDKISVNGTIESSEKRNVYAQLNYQVEKINVSAGDYVKKGDVLCTISTDELQQQILQQQAAVESSGISSDYSLSEAERRYSEALAEYENGENAIVMNAAKVVEQAEKSLEEAKRQESFGKDTTLPSNIHSADVSVESTKLTYENAKIVYDNSVKTYEDAEKALKPENYSADLKALKENIEETQNMLNIVTYHLSNPELEKAKSDYEIAQEKYLEMNEYITVYSADYVEEVTDEYRKAKTNYETIQAKYDKDSLEEQMKNLQTKLDSALEALEKSRDSAKINMDSAKINMDSAKLAYDNALTGYDNVQKQNNGAEENYGIAVRNAESALETAKKDYELAVRQAESELSSLKKAAEQQRTVSGLNDPQVIMLQNLKDKLEYAVVTAPCDGTITAVNAEEGAVAAGALFTIENIDALKISASVGEYDIPYIKEGMDAVIRCDALGDTTFDGKITFVSKTPAAGSAYSSQSGTSYKIEVSINDDDERLLAGMNAKLNIISERKENALTITYDALTTDDNGNDAVYAAIKGEDGIYRAKLINVTVGLETDYEIEIISSELKEGMYVLTNTAAIMDGSAVMIDEVESGGQN